MESTIAHVHNSIRKDKIIRFPGGDRYQQVLEHCLLCRKQTLVRVTELKRGDHRDSNH